VRPLSLPFLHGEIVHSRRFRLWQGSMPIMPKRDGAGLSNRGADPRRNAYSVPHLLDGRDGARYHKLFSIGILVDPVQRDAIHYIHFVGKELVHKIGVLLCIAIAIPHLRRSQRLALHHCSASHARLRLSQSG
jgi:hypothetical protein